MIPELGHFALALAVVIAGAQAVRADRITDWALLQIFAGHPNSRL